MILNMTFATIRKRLARYRGLLGMPDEANMPSQGGILLKWPANKSNVYFEIA